MLQDTPLTALLLKRVLAYQLWDPFPIRASTETGNQTNAITGLNPGSDISGCRACKICRTGPPSVQPTSPARLPEFHHRIAYLAYRPANPAVPMIRFVDKYGYKNSPGGARAREFGRKDPFFFFQTNHSGALPSISPDSFLSEFVIRHLSHPTNLAPHQAQTQRAKPAKTQSPPTLQEQRASISTSLRCIHFFYFQLTAAA